jgi:protein gp37
MSDGTGIEWSDATWNVVIGCDKVTEGCSNCYAIRTAHRFQQHPDPKVSGAYAGTEKDGEWTGQVNLLEDRLDMPLRWTRPRRIFVNAQSDLFHKNVPDEFIAKVFAVMALAPQHQFQILTKRHGRMRSLLNNDRFHGAVAAAVKERWGRGNWTRRAYPIFQDSYKDRLVAWPLPNVWLGVSVEDQDTANLRIHALLDTPAAVRWLSCEPLLGPVDLTRVQPRRYGGPLYHDALRPVLDSVDGRELMPRLDWIVVGGESGPGARPMHPAWARFLRDQCEGAGIPFLFKQWGEWATPEDSGHRNSQVSAKRWTYESVRFRPTGEHYSATADALDMVVGYSAPGMTSMLRVGKKKAGRVLDGQLHDGYPQDVTV